MALHENVVGLSSSLRSAAKPYADASAVRAAIREALVQAGLGVTNANVPFADIIHPGMTVLMKPNWVVHKNHADLGMDCMVTHPIFIECILEEVLAANPARVILGDAPMQSCDFDRLVPPAWRKKMIASSKVPLEIVDFRRTISQFQGSSLNARHDVRSASDFVLFDMGKESLLEPISLPPNRFRVTNYNPDLLAKTHCSGRHQYLVARELIESDVIINMPKLKTHKKAGVTAALKNLIGINGNKEYLPHHRVGGRNQGGDCYENGSALKRLAEFVLDQGNRRLGTSAGNYLYTVARGFILLNMMTGGDRNLDGSWWGNDTIWRTCLDLNRVLLYGRPDATIADLPQRRVYSITDGIVAGDREGPLAAAPVNMGTVTFAANSAFSDLVQCSLLQMDWKKIPIVREAFASFPYRLTTQPPESCIVVEKGKRYGFDDLHEVGRRFGRKTIAPQQWQGHVELQ